MLQDALRRLRPSAATAPTMPLPRACPRSRLRRPAACTLSSSAAARVRRFPSERSSPSDVETSAVVAMADDGGSTGLLREEAGRHAPRRRPQVYPARWRPTRRTRSRARSNIASPLRTIIRWANSMLVRARGCARIVPRGNLRCASTCSTRGDMCTPRR